MPEYVRQHDPWEDLPSENTPLNAASLGGMETGLVKASIVIVTSLPVSPDHGDEVYFEVESGLLWHLVYDSTIVDDYKWCGTGAPALTDEVLTSQGIASTTYVDLATEGPMVAVPLAGIYQIGFGASLSPSAGTAAVAVKLGAAAASDDDSAFQPSPGTLSVWREIEREVDAAAAVVKLQYRLSGAGTVTAVRRNLSVRPLRVG